MAYVDTNGLILIDEVEVAEDIKRLQSVLDIMNEVLETVNSIENINSTFDGPTASAITFSTDALREKLTNQKTEIEEEIAYINAVVTRYQEIDRKMRDLINSSGNGVTANE